MSNFIPLNEVKVPVNVPSELRLDPRGEAERDASRQRSAELGKRILQEQAALPQLKFVNCYFRHQTKRNSGFILLCDYYRWPRNTLHSRGYINSFFVRGKVLREATEEEQREYSTYNRCRSRNYQSFAELAEDERRVGSSEAFIEKLRRALDPTAEERHADALRRCDEDLLKYPVRAKKARRKKESVTV